MGENEYKISLGVDVKVDDIKTQIDGAKIDPIELKVEIKNLNEIKQQIQNLGGTKGKAEIDIPIDTESIKSSLDKVSSYIKEIKTAIGTLDSKSGMKSLLSSINQISSALDKASDKFTELNNNLSALANKDFSINFGINMGKSAAQRASEQGDVKRDAISQLKQQAEALENYLDQYYKVSQKGAGIVKLTQGTSLFNEFWEMSPNIGDTNQSLKQQIATYKQYIDLMQKAAKVKGVDLRGVASGFSKTTDEIEKEVRSVESGVKETEEQFKKIKGLLGGIDSEGLGQVLEPIIADLGDIKKAIQDLSKGIDVDKITQSFKEMSVVLDDITRNLTIFRNAFGNIGNGLGNPIGDAVKELKNGENILDSFKQSLKNIGMSDDKIETVANRIKNLGVQIETLNQSKSGIDPKEGVLSVDISGIDKFGNAVKLTQQYDVVTGNLIKSLDKVSTVQQKAGKSADTFAKQQKSAVSNLTNQINQLNRAANDQNAPKTIKDASHLSTLSLKYDEIISAIQRVGNASNDTFVDEQNNVKKLISEYKSLVKELRNAENVATSLRSKDISTVKETYSSKLDVLISKMRKDGVYTAGFEKGAENLRSVLSSATDASGLTSFLNGLDKLEAGYKRASASVKEFNQSQKVGINVSGLQSKIADIQRISPEIDKFETEIDGAKVSVQSLLNDLNRVKTQGDFSVVNSRFKAFSDAAKAAGISVTETVTKLKTVNEIKFKLADTGFDGFEQEVARADAAVKKLKDSTPQLQTALKQLKVSLETMNAANEEDDIQRLRSAYKEYEIALQQVNSQLKLNQQAEREVDKNASFKSAKAGALLRLKSLFSDNSEAAKKFGAELNNIQRELDECGDTSGLTRINQKITNLSREIKSANVQTQTFSERFKKQWQQYTSYLSVASLFSYAYQCLRDMFQQVVAIDTAMTELKKVTDETDASYNKFLSNAAKRSKELGTTIDGLVESTADFARLGYGFEDSQKLAEVANIYAVVGDEIEGVEGATQSLVSTMAAFKKEMNGLSDSDFALSIVDKMNEVDILAS